MGSIAAILRRDGGPADPAMLRSMLDRLSAGKSDVRSTRASGPVALGHSNTSGGSDALAIDADGAAAVLDGRLDDRIALAARLDLDPGVPDAGLLLAAFRRWNTGCFERVEGDFAVALWDPATQRLLIGRDRFGIKPAYYHENDGILLLASHPAAVLAVFPALGCAMDEAVAHAFAAGEAHAIDRTIYPGIRRLPPGHYLVASPERLEVARYHHWHISPRPHRSEASERFAELLTVSIRDRMAGPDRVGALLSGGLDSSSIVAIAAEIARDGASPPLRTYSQIFPANPAGDERGCIDALVTGRPVESVLLPFQDVAPFEDFEAVLDAQAMPFIAPNMATTRLTHRRAAADGIGVLLDGHGGDEVVSSGVPGLFDLAYHWRWIALWRQLRGLARVEGQSARRLMMGMLREKGPHRRLSGLQASLVRDPAWLAAGEQTACRPAPAVGREGIDDHLASVTSPYFVQALETLHRTSSVEGIELRFPFLERRLFEWCLAAAPDEKIWGGYTRALLRRGMTGLLPDVIRWRRDKHDFTGHVVRGMTRCDHELVDRMLADRDGVLQPFFMVAELRRIWAMLRSEATLVTGSEMQALWRAVTLGLWLQRGRKQSAPPAGGPPNAEEGRLG